MRRKGAFVRGQHLSIISWNVNGIRAAENKGLLQWLEAMRPDILALQETKATPDPGPLKSR